MLVQIIVFDKNIRFCNSCYPYGLSLLYRYRFYEDKRDANVLIYLAKSKNKL